MNTGFLPQPLPLLMAPTFKSTLPSRRCPIRPRPFNTSTQVPCPEFIQTRTSHKIGIICWRASPRATRPFRTVVPTKVASAARSSHPRLTPPSSNSLCCSLSRSITAPLTDSPRICRQRMRGQPPRKLSTTFGSSRSRGSSPTTFPCRGRQDMLRRCLLCLRVAVVEVAALGCRLPRINSRNRCRRA